MKRRIRRIIPLVLFINIVAFVFGVIFMLPDDLENLCQSIFATNFSANNILMKITSANYWDVKNDYKPLMHTWSLGVEEQFYIIYPFLFFMKGKNLKKVLPILLILTLISILLFYFSKDNSSKFYLIQYRFFELSIGGVCAIFFRDKSIIKNNFISIIFLIILFILLFSNIKINKDILVIMTTFVTVMLLISGTNESSLVKKVLSNTILVGIGKISFSLYMWHQLVFAFSRYFLFEKIDIKISLILLTIVFVLSVFSYIYIENIFRDKIKISTKKLLIILGLSFIITSSASLYVYFLAGIIKDYPQLDLYKSKRGNEINFFNSKDNIHIKYNEEVKKYEKPFSSEEFKLKTRQKKIKTLVLGNSYARDFTNILLESNISNKLEVRYSDLENIKSIKELKNNIKNADFIFYSSDSIENEKVNKKLLKYNIDSKNIKIVGTKDFGYSNGIHYNKKILDYSKYRAKMKNNVFERNELYAQVWKSNYINVISKISDDKGNVLIFTPEGKFISQDTWHLTKHGAIMLSKSLEEELIKIMGIEKIK